MVNTADSLRGVAGAWEPARGRQRVNDIWSMNPVRIELAIELPKLTADMRIELDLVEFCPSMILG